MEYVGMCIKESLRLYPPVPVVGREMSQDIIFDGHVMPKGKCIHNSTDMTCTLHYKIDVFTYHICHSILGTKVAFSVYALHRHAEVWGDDVEV